MNLYIDKDNLISFIESMREDGFVDCCRLIQRRLDLVFGFDKLEFKHLTEPQQLAITNVINDGRGWKEERDKYDSSYLDNKTLSPFLVLLMNKVHTSECCFPNLLLGTVGEEIKVLNKLFCRNDYDLHCEYNPQKPGSFPSWEKLESDGHTLPCSDIIIRDRYLFDNQKDLVKSNLYELIKVLTRQNEGPANLVIISIGNKTTDWNGYFDEIKKECKVNVTFVLAYPNPSGKGFVATIPHDRIILTNYRRYFSGDSFVYFKSNGDVLTTGDVFKVDSVADRETQSLVDTFISNTQNLCNTIREKEFGNIHYIIGDRKSNLLKF